MKKILFILFAAILLSAFIPWKKGPTGIQGLIEPADGAKKVWAISGQDTFSVIPAEGKFKVDTKAGMWRLIVEAVPPYKDAAMNEVFVQENQTTDVGVIKLYK
jgi:hypothetical protein